MGLYSVYIYIMGSKTKKQPVSLFGINDCNPPKKNSKRVYTFNKRAAKTFKKRPKPYDYKQIILFPHNLGQTKTGTEKAPSQLNKFINHKKHKITRVKNTGDLYKNINDPEFFEPDYERMYIQDSGDEGAEFGYDFDRTEEDVEATRKYELQKEANIKNKENEVYRLIALSDKSSDIIFDLENNIDTEESDIVRKFEEYNKKNAEEVVYPVFLNIQNPQYEDSISNENIREGEIKISKTSDGFVVPIPTLFVIVEGYITPVPSVQS